jgi:YjbE family integral membrane protein
MFDFVTADALWALLQVIVIDVVLAGDNAVVVGVAAAGLPRHQRGKVIMIGIAAATVLRVLFSAVTIQLLQIIGLMLAGGLLLVWVSWKLWRELEDQRKRRKIEAIVVGATNGAGEALLGGEPEPRATKNFRQAVTQIVVADVAMSLDNVLAVAGAASDYPWVLIFGLVLSVALMGAAAAIIAELLQRHRWIAYVGLALIFYVALRMIWDGGQDVMAATLVTS